MNKERKKIMETIQRESGRRSPRGMVRMAVLLAAVAVVFAFGLPAAGAGPQRLFSSPEDALKALSEAVKAKDKAALDQIFGPSGKELRSADEVQAAAEFEEFANNLAAKSSLVKESDAKVILHIGNENWPFPIPIVQKDGQWYFDTEAGKEEILNRRVGENELTAILVCRSYVKAQLEYAIRDWDGDGVMEFAQKFRSEPGKKDGLFWRAKHGEAVSPFGELVAQAWKSGYKKEKAAFKEATTPFHGYYFRILTRQGNHAPGGKYSYIIHGNMVAGFALVAFPADWGKSGVMTFIVNQSGTVYQKNLGPNTVKSAQEMKDYDPDDTWQPVSE